jgi:hypothetical protein
MFAMSVVRLFQEAYFTLRITLIICVEAVMIGFGRNGLLTRFVCYAGKVRCRSKEKMILGKKRKSKMYAKFYGEPYKPKKKA